MLMANILISAPIVLMFIFIALRCLMEMGLNVNLPGPFLTKVEQGPVSTSREVLKVFLFSVGFRLMILGALFVCSILVGEGEGAEVFFSRLQRWDAKHYVNLVEQGYSQYMEDGEHLFLVFYPLYVWVVRLFRIVIPNTVAAGLTVSILSYGLGCCYVYKLAELKFGRRTAMDSVIFLSFFPFSFFFGTVMTEGLFLLTTAGAIYYAMRHKWLLFGIFGALSAMNRMVGVLVIVPAAVEMLSVLRPLESIQALKRGAVELLKRILLLMMPLLGTGAYLALNYHVDGDPFAFIAHQEHWHQGGMWVSKVLIYIFQYLKGNIFEPTGWAVWAAELLLFLIFFIVLLLAMRDRQCPPSLLAYAFCYLIANYSLSWLLSAGRYLSCGFPLFIFLAKLTERRPNVRWFILGTQAVFLGIYLFAYVNRAQVM